MRQIGVVGGVVLLVALAVYGLPRSGVETGTDQFVAAQQCHARTGNVPPEPFKSDGCSMWPDTGIQRCCVRHDMRYWCGGDPAYRRIADNRFASCVARSYAYVPAEFVYAAVRVGGAQVLPLPWRWGYGYPYLE